MRASLKTHGFVPGCGCKKWQVGIEREPHDGPFVAGQSLEEPACLQGPREYLKRIHRGRTDDLRHRGMAIVVDGYIANELGKPS